MKTKPSISNRIFTFSYVLLVSVIFYSCEPTNNEQQKKVKATQLDDFEVLKKGVQIITIDSCEYVWCSSGYGAGLTHKGNCKFCEELSKK